MILTHQGLSKGLWIVLALLIALGPGLVQLFNLDIPGTRGWRMYSTVGIGAPYGGFSVLSDGQPTKTVAVTETLGMNHIRELQLYPGSGSVKSQFVDRERYRALADPICRTLAANERLVYSGRVATRQSWMDLNLSHEELCGEKRTHD